MNDGQEIHPAITKREALKLGGAAVAGGVAAWFLRPFYDALVAAEQWEQVKHPEAGNQTQAQLETMMKIFNTAAKEAIRMNDLSSQGIRLNGDQLKIGTQTMPVDLLETKDRLEEIRKGEIPAFEIDENLFAKVDPAVVEQGMKVADRLVDKKESVVIFPEKVVLEFGGVMEEGESSGTFLVALKQSAAINRDPQEDYSDWLIVQVENTEGKTTFTLADWAQQPEKGNLWPVWLTDKGNNLWRANSDLGNSLLLKPNPLLQIRE